MLTLQALGTALVGVAFFALVLFLPADTMTTTAHPY